MAEPQQPRMSRPRLSLQTKPANGTGIRPRNYFSAVDPKSPTAFNTLSNVYVTAIERSTPVTQSTPITAIKTTQPLDIRIESDTTTSQSQQPIVRTPFTAAPGTPLSANSISPAQKMDIVYPSTMTPTPPLSAGSVDPGRRIFTFNASDISHQSAPSSPTVQTRCRISYTTFGSGSRAPYSLNRSLHSILRNSPLQSLTVRTPSSPSKQPVRMQEKAERRVGYDSPLTQTITTEKYTKSHIDLLAEEASPFTPSPVLEDSDMMLDLTPTCAGDETRDGGQTPGPFEDMRRRMTSLATKTSIPSARLDGIRKRKRKEKKRKWVWTIGKDDDESESVAMAAIRAAAGETSMRRDMLATAPEPACAPGTSTTENSTENSTAEMMCLEPAEPEPDSTTT